MATATVRKPLVTTHELPSVLHAPSVGGPVSGGWRESTLTRAMELDSLSKALTVVGGPEVSEDLLNTEVLLLAIGQHVQAARDAAKFKRRFWRPRKPSLMERAMSNLDAAEVQLLNMAPSTYILGQLPSLLNQVQRHLSPTDARRKNFEQLAAKLGVADPDRAAGENAAALTLEEKKKEIVAQRGTIASAVRGASSAALREQLQVRSFRNVVVAAIVAMTALAVGVAIMGFVRPTAVPLCFQPESGGQITLVCPTDQSMTEPVAQGAGQLRPDIDAAEKSTAQPIDLFVVEMIGLAAAAVAATAALHGIRGSSERYGLPVALAVLKLPTGAVTAFLGLLLMRGQFVPGLTALDTSAQILAWALVFGYGQQLFTRLVDQQAHTVLNGVRSKTDVPAAS